MPLDVEEGSQNFLDVLGAGGALVSSKAEPRRSLGCISIAFLTYIAACGGPFGIETAVGAAGVLPTLLAVLGLGLVWVLPQALMVAELSIIYSSNGGYITWVSEALGPWAGWINGWNSVGSNLVDLALYPVLLSAYVREGGAGFDANSWPDVLLKLAACLVVLVLNIRGMEAVALSSTVATVIILAPFVFMCFMVRPDPSAWVSVAPASEFELSTFVGATLWAVQGFDSMGCIAGEVRQAGRSYPLGVAVAAVMIVANYILPIMAAASADPNYAEWEDGSFAAIAKSVAPWLGYFVVASTGISVLGEFNAVMGTSSRALQRMGRYGMLPAALGANAPRVNTPVVAILCQTGVCLCLMWWEFETLVVVDTLFNNISLILEVASFLYLKHTQPDLARPFAVPGRLAGAWAISTPKFLVIIGSLVACSWQAVAICLGSNVVIVATGYFWSRTAAAQRAAATVGLELRREHLRNAAGDGDCGKALVAGEAAATADAGAPPLAA